MIGTRSGQHHTVSVGGQVIDLPIVPIAEASAIALLVVFDQGSVFLERAAGDLAAAVAQTRPDAVAGIATLGVPVAYALARALSLDDWVVLQKTRKIHLRDALRAPVRSITTTGDQELFLDRDRAGSLAGRRVVVVDDVVSTGASVLAAIALLREAGAEVVAVATLLTEGEGWRADLGEDARLVRSLGVLPMFQPADDGSWTPRPVNAAIEE